MTTYPGGKAGAGVYQQIINQIPPHRLYIEAFLGAGAIMRYKRPAMASIGIDIDAAVISAFTAPILGLDLIVADALEYLKTVGNYHLPGTFIYLDPPYLMEVRSSKRRSYTYEYGEVDQHTRLLEFIKTLSCPVAISGYRSDLYADLLPDWRTIDFPAMTRGGTIATETLWMNYPEPLELHDYRYLGNGYRERERIKRKKARWIERLRTMPSLERYALLNAMQVLTGGSDEVAGGARNAENGGGIRKASPGMAAPADNAIHGDSTR